MSRDAKAPAAGPRVFLLADGPMPAGLADLVAGRSVAEAGESAGVLDVATPEGAQALLDAVHARHTDGRDLVLLDAHWLSHATVYGDLVADPRRGAAVLGDGESSVMGLRLGPDDRRTLPDSLSPAEAPVVLGRLADALRVARGPRELTPGPFPHTRVAADLAAARQHIDAADESALRLRRASRSDDGFLSAFLIRPLSRQVTKRVVRTGLSPAAITAGSLTLGLGSAAAYGMGGLGWLLTGSALLLCSLVVDCVDGEVARYTRTFSPLGGWLDVASDRIKEYAVYAGLAIGAGRAGGERPWAIALAAMAVLVVRHFVDFGFAASAAQRTAHSPVAALSESTSRTPFLMWAKRAVIMPVGERTILLIALVPVLGARRTLWLLFALGILAGAYTTAGRVGRTWASSGEQHRESPGAQRLIAQCDALPLPAGVQPVTGRMGWLAPALARALEIGIVTGIVVLAADVDLLAGGYAALAVAAFRGYDIAYRQRLAAAIRADDTLRASGWPVRVVAVALLSVLAGSGLVEPAVANRMLILAALGWGLVALWASARWWGAQGARMGGG